MFHPTIKNIYLLCLLTSQAFISSYTPLNSFVATENTASEGFALVELFTSEGCSSCPPADEVIGRLRGWKNNVYVLSFHVDYWNYLGWNDVFSNASYSSRQQDYGSLFHLNSIYTPQIIVNGKSQFAGSDESRLRETIESYVKDRASSEIYLRVQPSNRNQVSVSWNTEPKSELTLSIALVQNFTKDFIQRGENKGQTLNHYFTVRDFQSIQDQTGSGTSLLSIPAGLQSSDCLVVAFLQNPKTGYIVAAKGSPIP
jgi:hypothetical protein